MDKPIAKKHQKNKYKTHLLLVLPLLAIVAFLSIFIPKTSEGKVYKVTSNNLIIDTVKQASFSEYLPLRGRVEPQETIFIDTIDGGRIEKVFQQEGTIVEKGQAILQLSNTDLQLNVLAREAEVSEQINNMRNTRLALEQNQLALKRDVIELDFAVLRLEKELARSTVLINKKLISRQAFEKLQDELAFQIRYREAVKQSQDKEALLQNQQLAQLKQSITTLENNLAISRSSLEKLIIRAPRNGQLTFLDAKVGESKKDGQRLGQLDIIANYKVSAQVDEFYANRVAKGQTAIVKLNNRDVSLTVNKIYPGINNGTFKVDFQFSDQLDAKLLRLGQSLQLNFNLSENEEKLLIANGGFMQNSAGNWAFVLDSSGTTATKRSIKLGRKNPQSIEVLSGLQAGERVVTSSYASFKDAQSLQLNN